MAKIVKGDLSEWPLEGAPYGGDVDCFLCGAVFKRAWRGWAWRWHGNDVCSTACLAKLIVIDIRAVEQVQGRNGSNRGIMG